MKNIHEQVFNCQNREEKKELLKSLSVKAKKIIELKGEGTVNNTIISFYKNDTHQVFKTFNAWKKESKKVKKGEKAFFVWSKKLDATKQAEKDQDEKEYKFFSIAYLFSNAQVEPMQKKQVC
jgi:hypothetical protein